MVTTSDKREKNTRKNDKHEEAEKLKFVKRGEVALYQRIIVNLPLAGTNRMNCCESRVFIKMITLIKIIQNNVPTSI